MTDRKRWNCVLLMFLFLTQCFSVSSAGVCEKHDYQPVEKLPDCIHAGYRGQKCSICGQTKEFESMDKLGHQTEAWTVISEPTCTKEGIHEAVCVRCGEKQTFFEEKLPHSYVAFSVDPTCKKDGYMLHTCVDCGNEYKTDRVKATGHDYTATVTAATCTADGYTRWVCSNCGDSYRTDPVKKTGHRYNNGIITKEPTWTTMGRKTFTCYGCGDTYQETTPRLSNPFVDIWEGQYHYDSVIWAVGMEITKGTDDAHFSPNSVCTRSQVVTFLWRAAGQPDPKSTHCNFVDVPPDAFYRPAVMWAVEKGITNGVDATHFAPGQSCTRGHVVTFLHRSKGLPPPRTPCGFSDVPTGAYYYDAVRWCSENGITTGTGGNRFSPDAPCTRAQIVVFLHRAKGK